MKSTKKEDEGQLREEEEEEEEEEEVEALEGKGENAQDK